MGYCFEIHIFPRRVDAKVDASKFVAALDVLCESNCVHETTELRHGTEEVDVGSRIPLSEIELLMSSDFSLRWLAKNGKNIKDTDKITTPPTVPFVYKTVSGETGERALNLVDLRIISTKDLMLWGTYSNVEYTSEKLRTTVPEIVCECGFELTYQCNPTTISGGFGNNIRMMHSCPQCRKKSPVENLKGVNYKCVLRNTRTNGSLDLIPASGYVISMNVSTVPDQLADAATEDCNSSFERFESFAVAPEFLSKLEAALECPLAQILTYSEVI